MASYHRLVKLLRYGTYTEEIENRTVEAFMKSFPAPPVAIESAFGGQLRHLKPNRDLEKQVRLAIRHGFFLRIVANTEWALRSICEIVQDDQRCRISVDNVRGQSPRKFRDYLEKVGYIDFKPEETSWRHLENLFLIRHAWAHADGSIKHSDQDKLRKFVESNSANVNVEDSVVIIKPALVSLAADTAITVLMHIDSQIEQSLGTT